MFLANQKCEAQAPDTPAPGVGCTLQVKPVPQGLGPGLGPMDPSRVQPKRRASEPALLTFSLPGKQQLHTEVRQSGRRLVGVSVCLPLSPFPAWEDPHRQHRLPACPCVPQTQPLADPLQVDHRRWQHILPRCLHISVTQEAETRESQV